MKSKNIKNALIALTFLFMFSINSNAQISKVEIRATGLTCSMCSNAIYKQLESIPEVETVETDLNTNTFTVILKEENNLSPRIFKEKVEKAGFFVGTFIVTAKPETTSNGSYVLLNDKPNSASEIKFQLLDKGYVTEKEYKKTTKSYKEVGTYTDGNEDNFHIKIID
ncbi:MAG: hypothetical protein RL308_2881 [Bacteroidota bacterium]|jgi:copper chaperone CopZ